MRTATTSSLDRSTGLGTQLSAPPQATTLLDDSVISKSIADVVNRVREALLPFLNSVIYTMNAFEAAEVMERLHSVRFDIMGDDDGEALRSGIGEACLLSRYH